MAFFDFRRSAVRQALAILGLVSIPVLATALAPTSSASYSVYRTSANNGSGVAASANFRTLPHVVGTAAVGQSASGSFRINHGRIARGTNSSDDVYVDPTWLSQGDVDADPTIGTAGCKATVFPLVLGINAFADIPNAVAAVNPFGRVHVMNGSHLAEQVVVDKTLSIFGEDESVGTCSGFAGRPGAVVSPVSGTVVADKAVFALQAPDVQISDMVLDGMLVGLPTPGAEHGVFVSDATSSVTGTLVDNVRFSNFNTSGVYLLAPNTSGHRIVECDFAGFGDQAPGGSGNGRAIVFAGASGEVTSGTIQLAWGGVQVYGSDTPTSAILTGSGAIPDVIVQNLATTGVGYGAGVAYRYSSTGLVYDSTFDFGMRGVAIEDQMTTGTVVVENNKFNFSRVGVEARRIAAYSGASAPGRVVIQGNEFNDLMQYGIQASFIGRDSSGPTDLGEVVISGNQIPTVSNTYLAGIVAHAVDPNLGSVAITGNTIDGNVGGTGSGILIPTEDPQAVDTGEFSTANTSIDGNTIRETGNGVLVRDSIPGGVHSTVATVGTNSSNRFEDNTTGLSVQCPDSLVTVGSNGIAGQTFANNGTGVDVAGTNARADLYSNTFSDNTVGVTVGDDGQVLAENNRFLVPASGIGFRAVGGSNATGDLGGGSLGSLGGNNLDVGTDGWGASIEVAGTYRAEGNTWKYDRVTYNAAVAVDDLIRDGDADNTSAGGEVGTIGPLDFLPFNAGSLANSVTVNETNVRGTTAGYGVTQFRTLSDGIEGVASAGDVSVDPGSYKSVHYDAAADYVVPGLILDRPVDVAAVPVGGATVYPVIDGPGTNVATIREAGSTSLFVVESDDVALKGLVLDGDSPDVPGTTLVNGIDINARNGVVIDGSADDGPDNLEFIEVSARNFYYNGIVVEPFAGHESTDLVVVSSSFDNIDAFALAGARSTGIDFENVRYSEIGTTKFRHVRGGLRVAANDAATTHSIVANNFSDVGEVSIAAGSISNAAQIVVSDNDIATTSTGIDLSDVTASASALALNNTITSGSLQLRVRGVDANSFVLVRGNTFVGEPGSTGVLTADTDSVSTPTATVSIDLNTFQDVGTGIRVTDTSTTGTARNTGTRITRNSIVRSNKAVVVDAFDAAPAPVYASIGGLTVSDSNTLTSSTVAVHIQGGEATADIVNNTAIDGQTVGVLVSAAGAARVADNVFSNSAFAGISVTELGSEALIERNDISAYWNNQRGIHTSFDSIAGMGPGSLGPPMTNAFFGGFQSVGLNKLRAYTGAPSSFAIQNLSALDQNAENNDFGSLDTLGYIESVVDHKPDNAVQGLVFFDPPSSQFLGIDDWTVLNQQ